MLIHLCPNCGAATDSPTNLLGAAFELAFSAHAGQVDKSGAPYITHLVRVASRLSGESVQVVALLHDIVEDTDVTLSYVGENFGPETAAAVDALSKRNGEAYEEYIARVRGNRIAMQVKFADLADNSDPSRLALLAPAERSRLEAKYALARKLLNEAH